MALFHHNLPQIVIVIPKVCMPRGCGPIENDVRECLLVIVFRYLAKPGLPFGLVLHFPFYTFPLCIFCIGCIEGWLILIMVMILGVRHRLPPSDRIL